VDSDIIDAETDLGQHTVLRRIYKESYPIVRSYVLANSGTEPEAKDVFQEAVTNAWINQQKGSYTPRDNQSVGAYVFTIAKYKWLDKLKSKSHKSTMRLVTEEVSEREQQDAGLDDIDVAYLNTLYARLDDKCKVMLKKFYFEKMSMREIAADLGVGEESVRTMKYRCVMKLRKMHLEQQGE